MVPKNEASQTPQYVSDTTRPNEILPQVDEETQSSSNAYEQEVSKGRKQIIIGLAITGIVSAIVGAFVTDGPSLWGLLPILLYSALALLGMDIVIATVVAITAGAILGKVGVTDITTLLGESLGDQITMIGLIIMLGSGVGEVLKTTGAAERIVSGVMRVFGSRGKVTLILGIMMACLVLVASLGTLVGAIAIAAPILIPVAGRAGYTRSATAAMMFVGGCAGLALAPFAGSNIAIMEAAEVSYLEYLLYGAGPIAIISIVVGVPVVLWMQKWTKFKNDFYSESELGYVETSEFRNAGRATTFFLLALLISVVYATIASAGTAFPLLALPALAVVTGIAGGKPVRELLQAIYRGCSSMVSIFIFFWMLGALFKIIDLLAPFDYILDTYGKQLESTSPFVFTIIIALLGWVGVPGATAAQVVLLDKVFGSLGSAMGVSAASWTVVLLFASKADTYGPFPNGNMMGVMGLARSKQLKNMMITGWLVLIPVTVTYFTMLFFQTR
ncbi:Na+/H+ antiporter NhaC family protein [Gulosibacter bifidus]|uniref:Na+/H+ antiporter NhaC family protein n=1 Tax=Gulosibacter bifidus TaxID=272239 RepID=A0ABW5RI74_9MICO|nr:Na+/H+ antiporter NhaC family protein [Gulosibacter bifidus]